ncbi:MAG: hypothetical protein AAFX06_12540 [Planctomycetota bacterium]
MFCSLDKIDIVANKDGQKVAIQTEHRSAEEIDSERALSTLMAITRVTAALADPEIASVQYHCQNAIPDWYADVITAAGGSYHCNATDDERPAATDDAACDQMAEEALRELGRGLFSRSGVPLTRDGLTHLEDQVHAAVQESGGHGEDEYTYWKSVLELGAATGEAMRVGYGGEWSGCGPRGPEDADVRLPSLVPYAFRIGEVAVNVFAKAVRFLEEGEHQACSRLMTALDDVLNSDDQGQVFPMLRASDWNPGTDSFYGRPLLPELPDEAGPSPLLTLVRDLPSAVQFIPGDTSEEELGTLRDEAKANLQSIEVDVQVVEAEGRQILIVGGHYFAAEKVLDREFMKSIEEQLGVDRVAATAPARGMLFAASGDDDETIVMLAGLAHQAHADCDSGDQISPGIFLLEDGQPIGFTVLDMEEDE